MSTCQIPYTASRYAPQTWGMQTLINLYNCNGDFIRDAEKIKKYVIEICDAIDMKRFGECQVVHFGEDEKVAGFSMTQLIETSLISAHFVNETNKAFIDIFSCKTYDAQSAYLHTKNYFEAERGNFNVIVRA